MKILSLLLWSIAKMTGHLDALDSNIIFSNGLDLLWHRSKWSGIELILFMCWEGSSNHVCVILFATIPLNLEPTMLNSKLAQPTMKMKKKKSEIFPSLPHWGWALSYLESKSFLEICDQFFPALPCLALPCPVCLSSWIRLRFFAPTVSIIYDKQE